MPKLSRRQFACSTALASLLSPLVSLVGPEPSPARAAPGKAKFLLVFFTNATDSNLWAPRGSSLNEIKFSRMTELLAPLKKELVLVDNLDSRGTAAGHAAPGGITGKTYGGARVSLDQFVSDKLIQANVSMQIPNLVLGGTKTGDHSIFFRDGLAIDPIYSVTSAFETIFGNVGGNTDTGAVAAQLARRKSILDALNGELRSLSGRLGSAEREKLGLYTDSIRQLEERIAGQMSGGGGGGSCTRPSTPTEVSEDVVNSSTHLDIAVNAMACGITRVASVAFGHHQSCQVSIPEVDRPGDWHNDFTHSDSGERTRMTNLERWLCGEFVRTIEKLKTLPSPEGGGTLYDHTLVVWARDMGDAVIHNGNMRFVLAGGAGGYLKTSANGRFVDGQGDAHQRLLFNCIEAMGITQFDGFGDGSGAGEDRQPLSEIGG